MAEKTPLYDLLKGQAKEAVDRRAEANYAEAAKDPNSWASSHKTEYMIIAHENLAGNGGTVAQLVAEYFPKAAEAPHREAPHEAAPQPVATRKTAGIETPKPPAPATAEAPHLEGLSEFQNKAVAWQAKQDQEAIVNSLGGKTPGFLFPRDEPDAYLAAEAKRIAADGSRVNDAVAAYKRTHPDESVPAGEQVQTTGFNTLPMSEKIAAIVTAARDVINGNPNAFNDQTGKLNPEIPAKLAATEEAIANNPDLRRYALAKLDNPDAPPPEARAHPGGPGPVAQMLSANDQVRIERFAADLIYSQQIADQRDTQLSDAVRLTIEAPNFSKLGAKDKIATVAMAHRDYREALKGQGPDAGLARKGEEDYMLARVETIARDQREGGLLSRAVDEYRKAPDFFNLEKEKQDAVTAMARADLEKEQKKHGKGHEAELAHTNPAAYLYERVERIAMDTREDGLLKKALEAQSKGDEAYRKANPDALYEPPLTTPERDALTTLGRARTPGIN